MDQNITKALTWTTLQVPILAATSNNGNINSAGIDTAQYIGHVGVQIEIGAQATSGAAATITATVLSSATNNIANATAVAASTNSLATTNNAASQTTYLDKRADNQYLFVQFVTTAVTNTPSTPVAAVIVGRKQVQP